jgi:integrase
VGNWLTVEEARALWQLPNMHSVKGKRDRAILAVLLGCGLRRRELIDLTLDHIQRREDHWAILDLVGKGGHIRTVPMPDWVKQAIDHWLSVAQIARGRIFRCVCRRGLGNEDHGENGLACREGIRGEAGSFKARAHDLRRSCARFCHDSGGELEQIQFLLGHVSVQTTEKYWAVSNDSGRP